MNVLAAIEETFSLAVEKSRGRHSPTEWAFYHPSLGLDHLRDMHRRCHEEPMSSDKLNRWLGWMQAAVVCWDIGVTVEDMKTINERHK